MNQLLSFLITLLITYDSPIAMLIVFSGSIGVPIPSEAFIMAAGSLSVGKGINTYILILLLTAAAILGDIVVYYVGKKYGYSFIENYGKWIGLTVSRLNSHHVFFDEWGGWAIFITRWLITPLGMPVSLLAGITKYPLRGYFIYAGIGELLWVSIYVYLGYVFGANWLAILAYVNNILGFLFFFTIGIGFIYLSLKIIKIKSRNS